MSSRTAGSRVMPLDLASGLPFALALRIGIAAVTILTAPRRGVARRVAFLGSAAASLATGSMAAQVLAHRHAGERRPIHTSRVRIFAGVFD